MAVPVKYAKASPDELARAAYVQHKRFTLTRNGTPEAVLLSFDDREGMEITLEVLATEIRSRQPPRRSSSARGERSSNRRRLGRFRHLAVAVNRYQPGGPSRSAVRTASRRSSYGEKPVIHQVAPAFS